MGTIKELSLKGSAIRKWLQLLTQEKTNTLL